jgi:NitT/TauT family transport system substrate-binding protein
MIPTRSVMWIPVFVLAALLALSAVSCGGDDEAGGTAGATTAEQESQKVSIVMNWFAQAEQGGYFQADAQGLASDDGVEIGVVQGGPQIQTIPQVASGQFDYGVAQADEIILARAEGVPIVEIFAAMDTNPQCMMFHPNQGIESFEDFDGHPIAVAPSGGFWPWMKGHFDYQKVREVNFTGQLADFNRDDTLIQQCFITSEPFVADQEGIEHEELLIADAGYNPYANGIFTTETKLRESPDEVAAVVAAVKEGWETYMNGDGGPGDGLILDVNEEMSQDKLDFARDTMNERLMADEIGCMTEDRWQTLEDQLTEANVLTDDIDVGEAFTNEFVPGCE